MEPSFETMSARRTEAILLLAQQTARGAASVFDMLHQIKIGDHPRRGMRTYVDVTDLTVTTYRGYDLRIQLRYAGAKMHLPSRTPALALDGSWSRGVPYVIAPHLELTVFDGDVRGDEVKWAMDDLFVYGILTETDLMDFETSRRAARTAGERLPPLYEEDELESVGESPSPTRSKTLSSWWVRILRPLLASS